MAAETYWHSILRSRVARRRAVLTASGAATGALFLAACGGSGSSVATSKTPAQTNSLVTAPEDSTAKAVAGGTLKDYQTTDILNFDAGTSNASGVVNLVSVFAYPRMLQFVPAKAPGEPDGSTQGELAESFELSPDGLQLTFKVRGGMKWDSRPPTSGRIIDSSDVLASWSRFSKASPSAQDLAYDMTKSPNAPVESVTAADASTVVMKLKQPNASLLQLFAAWDHFYVLPKEAGSTFDPRTDIRGHGPWLLDEYVPSARVVWKRNPDYYVKDRPYPDRLERPIVSDYSQRLAQFKAGNIYTDVVANSQQDVIVTKRDTPKAVLRQADTYSPSISSFIAFGYEGNSPFKDTRMRQAVSLTIDRTGFVDVIENRDNFRKDGLDVDFAYNTIVAAGWPGYWLDPGNTKDFGDTAKYLTYDPAEAKKLMSAAGYTSGVDFDMFYDKDNTYGDTYARIAQLYAGMLQNGDLRPRQNSYPYQQYLDNFYLGYISKDFAAGIKKGYNGLAFMQERGFPTLPLTLSATLHKDGSVFHGMSPTGQNAHLGDPKVNDWVEKISTEIDTSKRQGLVHDLIKYFTGQAYYIPKPSNAKAYSLWWPAISNVGVYRTLTSGNIWVESQAYWWLDQSKAPLGNT